MHQPADLPERRPPPETVRAQLARILHSPQFHRAPALSRLLTHLVECTLRGRSDELKEYALGVEVFDRGESFDPTTDTIVRVQVRRLRGKLDDYFSSHGHDPVRIEIPTGRYAAVFSFASEAWSADEPASGARLPQPAYASLSRPRTPLIGRRRELDALVRLLRADGVRLVTVTGAGGSGKTRLALEAARMAADHFAGGVLVLSLAPFVQPEMLPAALAQSLGVRHTGGRPLPEALRAALTHVVTAPTLLLLDNFEHLLAAAPFVVDLLEASSRLKVLVTSRTALHLYGEQEFPLAPLQLPEPGQELPELQRSPAVQLFLQRAQLVNPLYAFTGEDVRSVADICRRLDGLPLAIELAAARIKVFPPEAMLPRLTHSLEFLTDGARDLPARQQTLRNTIDWSHALLTAAERRLFRRLAVFVGGCTLEGAEAVCNAQRDLELDPVTGMSSLVDKHLVQQVGSIGGEARFNMLETIREYAMEQLGASGDERPTRRAHAAYCIVLAEEVNVQQISPSREQRLARCDVELDNFRAALDWLVSAGNADWALRLGVALFGFWEPRELLQEARGWLDAITGLPEPAAPSSAWARALSYCATICDVQGDHDRARVLHLQALEAFRRVQDRQGEAAQMNALAGHHRFAGEYSAARSYWEQTLTLCRQLGHDAEIAAVLSNLAGAVSHDGDTAGARRLLEEASSIFTRLGDQMALCWSVNRLGDVARQSGDLQEARRLYEASLEGFSRLGDPWGVGRSSADLAQVQGDLGDGQRARALFAEALKIFVAIDHKRGIARVLEGMAMLAQHEGQPVRALQLAGAAAAVRFAFGAAPRAADQAALDEQLAPAWKARAGPEARTAWDAGRRMSFGEAIRFALAQDARPGLQPP